MAHDPQKKAEFRAAYLSGLTLLGAAERVGVPQETGRKWKQSAARLGDDWDKIRSAQLLAGGNFEDVSRRLLNATVLQAESTLDSIRAAPEMKPEVQTQLLASLSDSLTKLVNASRKFLPEVDLMATKIETLNAFADFAKSNFPEAYKVLAEPLAAFARESS